MADKLSLGIVGTGLIGGSIVEAAVAAGAVGKILLVDRDAANADHVAARHAIARRADVVADLAGCDIVFVCTPVSAIAAAVLALRGGPVVIDVGSIKQPVLEAVGAGGGNPRFVPGHPLSGGTTSGPEQASAAILSDRPFVLCPYHGIDQQAFEIAREFLARTGATTIEIEAATHDRLLALTSHVPHLIAFALVAALEALPEAERAAAEALMPNSFCAVTRFALSDARMWTDIFEGNRAAVSEGWEGVRREAVWIAGANPGELATRLEALRVSRERLGEGDGG